jgi:protein-S-isoprenylcysteine O-methyltransferase Ste14
MFKDLVEGINALFNNRNVRLFLDKLRYPIALILLGFFSLLIQPALMIPGFLVSMFGELIQLWSFATLNKNEVVVDKGPYSLVRNPMYIGRFFLLLGFMILTGNMWIILFFLVFYYFYAVNRVKREEKLLQSLFGKTYEAYCREVNRFLPSLARVRSGAIGHFDWHLLVKNHGHRNLIAVLCCYALFCLINSIK